MAKAQHPEQVAEEAAHSDSPSQPATPTKHRRGMPVMLEDPDEIVREQLGGFIKFLRDHAVVGVAIGFIVGLQAQTLIKQLVESFVTPLLTLMVGPDLQSRQWVINGGTANAVKFPWGEFVYSLADFIVVLLFIYLVVKIFQLDKLDKK
jgi:large-conductance mechanosensitive channel